MEEAGLSFLIQTTSRPLLVDQNHTLTTAFSERDSAAFVMRQAELLKLSEQGRPFNRALNYDFPEDLMTWSLADKGLGAQNDAVAADRAPQLGDVITTVPCAQAPKWVLAPVDSSNTTVGAPSTLSLKGPGATKLCLDSATLSQECSTPRQCNAALWKCFDSPPPAHTWSMGADGTLRNMRDAGFVGANGGASSGGEQCMQLGHSSPTLPIAASCKAGDKSLQWKANTDGTVESVGQSGQCLATMPPKAVVGVDQYMVGDDMMAAPVLLAGARERKVYFPKGADWKHHYTGDVYKGGSTEVVPAPLENFPLFHRVASV